MLKLMTKMTIKSSYQKELSVNQKIWLQRVSEYVDEALKDMSVPLERFTLDFDPKSTSDTIEFPVVRVLCPGGGSLLELLFAIPVNSPYLSLNFEITLNSEDKPLIYGPVTVRFGEKSIPSTWDSVAKALAFHSVLALSQGRQSNDNSVDPTAKHELALTSSVGRQVSRIKKAIFARITRRVHKRLQWGLGLIRHGKSGDSLFDFDNQPVHWITPPNDRFWADPQLHLSDNRLYLFYEELIFAKGVGTLACMEIDAVSCKPLGAPIAIELSPPTKAHLSFPNIFEHDSELLMIPECSESGNTSLYKCVEFPHKWQFERTLLGNVAGIDPVVYFADAVVYLFVGDGRLENYDNHLRLFYADSLHGAFVEHPQSPVSLGLEGSRMAGKLIKRSGKLFRVAQNCGIRYGASLSIFEVTTINKTEYKETLSEIVEPISDRQYPLGIHTFSLNEDSNVIAIDGLRLVKKV
jgi:hypothetical protein